MTLPIRISHDSAEPLYHQIATQLRTLIINGQLPAGTLLPSIRELSIDTECSVITIRRVYQELESEGLVRTKQGTGTFVTEVGQERKGELQYEAISEALRAALEQIRLSGLNEKQVRDLFEQILHEVFQQKGEG